MASLLRRQEGSDEEEDVESRRALRKFGAVRRMHREHERHPDRVLYDFDEEVIRLLGVAPGGSWTYRDYTAKLNFGYMRGLGRCHAYAGDILSVLKQNRPVDATVLVVQLMKALHQALLDGGDWSTATLYLPTPDPFSKKDFGGNESEAEAIASYRRARVDLLKAEKALGASSFADPAPTSGPPGPTPKKKALGKAKAKSRGGAGGAGAGAGGATE